MTNNFDAHDVANRARDIRGAYMAQSLSSMALSSMALSSMALSSMALSSMALSSMVKATISAMDIKSALGALASTAPLAGHRV